MQKLVGIDLAVICRYPPMPEIFNHPQDLVVYERVRKSLQQFKHNSYVVIGFYNSWHLEDAACLTDRLHAQMTTVLSLVPEIDTILACPDEGHTAYHYTRSWSMGQFQTEVFVSPFRGFQMPDVSMYYLCRDLVNDGLEFDEFIFIGDEVNGALFAHQCGAKLMEAGYVTEVELPPLKVMCRSVKM